MLHQFEKSAVTFRLGIIARKMQNGSNDSKLYLFKIFSCKLFSNHFIFNRQILFDFFLISFHQFLHPPTIPLLAILELSKFFGFFQTLEGLISISRDNQKTWFRNWWCVLPFSKRWVNTPFKLKHVYFN